MAAKQKQAQIMALARQTAEQGIGDNDLKRLQRQFDSNKATFVNTDQKQRFMKGGFVVDVAVLCLARPPGWWCVLLSQSTTQHQQPQVAVLQHTHTHIKQLHTYINHVQACGTLSWTLTT